MKRTYLKYMLLFCFGNFLYPANSNTQPIYGLSEKPSLIPEPVSVRWEKTSFTLYKGVRILSDGKMKSLLVTLQNLLSEKNIPVIDINNTAFPLIYFGYAKSNATHLANEAYHLTAGSD